MKYVSAKERVAIGCVLASALFGRAHFVIPIIACQAVGCTPSATRLRCTCKASIVGPLLPSWAARNRQLADFFNDFETLANWRQNDRSRPRLSVRRTGLQFGLACEPVVRPGLFRTDHAETQTAVCPSGCPQTGAYCDMR